MKLLRSFLIFTLVVLLSACNTATKVIKVQKWRNDFNNWFFAGYYDVQTLKAEKGNVEIPYEAAVEEGTILLQVTKDDKVIYEEEVTSQKEGLLSFEAPKSGSYDLIVRVKGEEESERNSNTYKAMKNGKRSILACRFHFQLVLA